MGFAKNWIGDDQFFQIQYVNFFQVNPSASKNLVKPFTAILEMIKWCWPSKIEM
jgi:hypothetical protein